MSTPCFTCPNMFYVIMVNNTQYPTQLRSIYAVFTPGLISQCYLIRLQGVLKVNIAKMFLCLFRAPGRLLFVGLIGEESMHDCVCVKRSQCLKRDKSMHVFTGTRHRVYTPH